MENRGGLKVSASDKGKGKSKVLLIILVNRVIIKKGGRIV